MKILSKLDNTGMIDEVTNKRYVTDAEKTAISHSNRTVLDKWGELDGNPTYNGAPIGGGDVENLTLTTLTLGNYKVSHNITNDTLDFEYIGG